MTVIVGFEKAKKALARRVPFEFKSVVKNTVNKAGRTIGYQNGVEEDVRIILNSVRDHGDRALIEYTYKFDGVRLRQLRVTEAEFEEATRHTDKALVSALELASLEIRHFHEAAKANGISDFTRYGMGQIVRPLEKIGIYVPGGRASYPSTVLMTAIPARIAGVKEIIMVTPPDRAGKVPAAILVAARIAGVDVVYKIGGAQAIGALAYGTATISKVDKICGPGNIFVTIAKKIVYGIVDIDSLAGPSEIMILADSTARPTFCAADLLAQAEHDPMAISVMVTTSSKLLENVRQKLATVKLELLVNSSYSVLRDSIEAITLVKVTNMEEAITLANLFAPEHLSLMLKEPDAYIDRIRNAGCVFFGGRSAVALGDYMCGPSHVLPTGGSSRFFSPLGIYDFLKVINIISVSNSKLKEIGPKAILIAEAEGLPLHARAIKVRLEKINGRL